MTGVNDTGDKLTTGVNDTGDNFLGPSLFMSVDVTIILISLVSMTPKTEVIHSLSVSMTLPMSMTIINMQLLTGVITQ